MVEETNHMDQNIDGTTSVAENLETVTDQATNQSEQPGTQPNTQEEESRKTQEQPKHAKTPQESFAELKKKTKQLEKERDEARQFAEQIYKKYESPQQKVEQVNEDYNIGDDDLVEGKHYKKTQQELKKLNQRLEQQQAQQAQIAIEQRLKERFPDFDKVVSKENVEMLSENEPEIAQSIRDTQDLYAKAVAAYKSIKSSGVYTPDLYEEDRKKAQQNAYKPRPTATISPQQGDTPLSHANAFANGLTEDLRKQLYKEMIESRKKM